MKLLLVRHQEIGFKESLWQDYTRQDSLDSFCRLRNQNWLCIFSSPQNLYWLVPQEWPKVKTQYWSDHHQMKRASTLRESGITQCLKLSFSSKAAKKSLSTLCPWWKKSEKSCSSQIWKSLTITASCEIEEKAARDKMVTHKPCPKRLVKTLSYSAFVPDDSYGTTVVKC